MNIKMKAIAILLSLVVLSGIAVASACDTRTPGYWRNHSWPISEGPTSFTYTDEPPVIYTHTWTLPAWFSVNTLNMPIRGDASINLEQKVIAAILSIAADDREGWAWTGNYENGPMDGKILPDLITESIDLLQDNPGPWTPGSDAAVRAQGLALASAIDYWLNFYDID